MDPDDSLPPLPVFSVLERGPLPEPLRNIEITPQPQPPEAPVEPVRPEKSLDPVAILQAAGERTRWRVLGVLSKGQPVVIRLVAKEVGVYPDLLSKHLHVLRACGAVVELSGRDARQRLQALAPEFIPRIEGDERVLDFGSCVLRFPRE